MGLGNSASRDRPDGMSGQAVRSIATRYLIVIIGMAISVLLSRALTASGRGAYAYIIAFASSAAWISHFSIETSLMLSWSVERERSQLVGAAIAVAAIAGTTAMALGIGAVRLFDLTVPEGGASWMLIAALLTIPSVLLALYLNAVLVNDGRIDEMNRVGLVTAIAQLIALVGLVLMGSLTVSSGVILWTASMFLPVVFLLPLVIRQPGVRWSGNVSVRRLLAVGLRYHPGAVALALILRLDILLLGSRVDVAQLGIYSLAVSLVELSLVATSASSQVAVQVQVRGEPHSHADFTAAVSRTNGVLAGVLMILLVAAGPWAITLIFGESYAGTTGPVVALAPGVVALSMMRPIAVFVTRLNRPYVVSSALIIGLVANIGLNLMMIPWWGIVGAAVASSLVYIGLLVWAAVWFLQATGLTWFVLIPTSSDFRAGWRALQKQLGRA